MEELIHHMEWADAVTWQAILESTTAKDDVLIRERLHHIHSVQYAFLNIWQNRPIKIPPIESFNDFSKVPQWVREYYSEVKLYLNDINSTMFQHELVIPGIERIEENLKIVPQPSNLGQSIIQVATHSTHHRAQIISQLRDFEVEPPMTDFIFWIWLSKPEPKWVS